MRSGPESGQLDGPMPFGSCFSPAFPQMTCRNANAGQLSRPQSISATLSLGWFSQPCRRMHSLAKRGLHRSSFKPLNFPLLTKRAVPIAGTMKCRDLHRRQSYQGNKPSTDGGNTLTLHVLDGLSDPDVSTSQGIDRCLAQGAKIGACLRCGLRERR
ncbi:hypothetical protein CSHISOI_08392 [Colletotrichum shisoi]|uniref:Uncharacterized protein n=1 Tax=Colletotrichum shisoi TaxID=2078593 RepID=A0A5Q4BKI9_9PEZI|nr:hypothetical protein CSHISOI_08392 [Colletotrichum shisoi]